MEIALLSPQTIKLKGKKTQILVDPLSKSAECNAALFLTTRPFSLEDVLSVDGPGEYEVGGTKIWGMWFGSEMVYGVKIDNVDIVIGKMSTLEKAHAKLSESTVVILCTDSDKDTDASFVTAFSPKYVVVYGDKAKETVTRFEKEGITHSAKLSVIAEKLPEEMEVILLQ